MAISGIGSGLDIRSMVDALVNAEKAPKTAQLNRLEKATTAKFSGVGQFRSALSTFQTALKGLNDGTLFSKRSAVSAQPDIFTVTSTSKAVAGNYNIQVSNLAQSSKVALHGVPNATDPVGSGSLSISVGEGEPLNVVIEEGKNNLSDIRDAINAAGKEAGLSATIVNDPNGEGGARLILSSTATGAGNDIKVVANPADGGLSVLNFPPALSDPDDPMAARAISTAADARFSIDGISLTSKTNTVTEAIDGVSITLKSSQSKEDIAANKMVALDVAQDWEGVKASLTEFVDSYNKMMGTIGSLTRVTSVGGDSGQPLTGALVGDASVRSFTNSMRSVLGSQSEGDIRMLADLGISTQRDGTLKIDDTRLDKMLETNFDKIGDFLSGGKGLMTRLESQVKPYTETGGLLESRTKSLQNTLSSVTEQREQLTRRTSQLETRLLAQFNAMDAMIGQLSSTSNYLTGVLESLPGVVKQSK